MECSLYHTSKYTKVVVQCIFINCHSLYYFHTAIQSANIFSHRIMSDSETILCSTTVSQCSTLVYQYENFTILTDERLYESVYNNKASVFTIDKQT